MELVLLVAIPVAIVAAIRGIWSPCGLSMLSSITPMTEAGRGNRFGVTAAWFAVGGIVGGLTTGVVAAVLAAGVHALGPSDAVRWGIAAALGVATAAIDLGLAGVELPIFKRQVNDAWLRRYRSWVYGAGFGWQIGTGVATYIMTGAAFLTIGQGVLTADPVAAIGVGLVFGTVRGSAVYIGRTGTTPAALGRIHARLEALAPASRAAAAWVQVLAAAILASAAWSPVVGIAIVLAATAAWLLRARAGATNAAAA